MRRTSRPMGATRLALRDEEVRGGRRLTVSTLDEDASSGGRRDLVTCYGYPTDGFDSHANVG
jgi:hypothetical protein